MNKTVCAIIAEYNPFHNGHLYHIEQTRRQLPETYIIAIMSGSYVQRGEPAILDKFRRARTAVENGCDLVIELPVVHSTASAEGFARGSVGLIDALQVVTHLSFGTESGNLNDLYALLHHYLRHHAEIDIEIAENMGLGLSYGQSVKKALKSRLPVHLSQVLSHSNNLLGYEYLKSLARLNSEIQPLTVKRKGSSYHDILPQGTFDSATAIRYALFNGADPWTLSTLPTQSKQDLKALSGRYPTIEDYLSIINYEFLVKRSSVKTIRGYEPGLENLLKKSLVASQSVEQLVASSVSKRYKPHRISRFLINTLLGIKEYNYASAPVHHIRPLCYNDRGSELLREIKHRTTLSILSKYAHQSLLNKHQKAYLTFDERATALYALSGTIAHNADYFHQPYLK